MWVTFSAPSTTETWHKSSEVLEKNDADLESLLEVLILLQKSMLEKQWNLSFDRTGTVDAPGEVSLHHAPNFVGLVGLLRGIEKFDSSKGFKISTYVYWWIRQGVSRALVENSQTLRLPIHLHERLSIIRNAKTKLQEKVITPSINRIAESLNMSKKGLESGLQATTKVFSLDREAFPTLNGLPGDTLHNVVLFYLNYIADANLENPPWHGVDEWSLKVEVNKLISTTLGEQERDIIRLYYGLDKEWHTWEDISRQIGLSRERVRQVGLVSLEKLKHAARKRRLDAILVKH
ncbi:RNA polymerase sigma factor sigA-like [Tasmannia lanceolata]|uniref:RNA polymerase sigma factor sigA-like n=1 Tax=Tasmannia lanceolata TaxID=3420 RepID=UPI004063A54A